ncbi:MAG: hypothetical protein V4502_06210 [Pseudomonadota bacterium]
MPTILEVKKPREATLNLGRAAAIADALNERDTDIDLTFANGSVVGTSKFLHFAFPDEYPIWDSRVRRALVGECPCRDSIGEYREYREALMDYADQEGRDMREVEQDLFWLDWNAKNRNL